MKSTEQIEYIRIGYHGLPYLVIVPAERKHFAYEILEAADDEGAIQAGDALKLFPGRPELHTCMQVYTAFSAAGFEIVEDE